MQEKRITKSYIKSTYNPLLDHLEGKLLFKKKLDRAKELLVKAGLPKEVIEQLNSEQNQQKCLCPINRGIFVEIYTKLKPVIIAGFSMPISSKIVGAMSPNFPFLTAFLSLSIKIQGTRFKLCCVLGEPSSLII
jgi:hypothetical protein